MHTERRRNAFLRERAKFFETRSKNIQQCWKHYKTQVNRALTEAKRTKCTWSAEEMRFYVKVLNSLKHTVVRTNTIKHQEIASEYRVESVICLNQTSILFISLEIALGGLS